MELQAFVDQLARAVKRPITLEDAAGRLLAYSAHEEPVDAVRMETLLRKGASVTTLEVLRQRGVYQSIDASDGVAKVPPIPEIGFTGRSCVAIRVADRVLGYLWVLDSDSPLSRTALEALLRARQTLAQELSKLGSFLLMRQEQIDQLLGDMLGRERADSGYLDRRAKAFGWRPLSPMQVMVVRPAGTDAAQGTDPVGVLSRVEDLFVRYAPSCLKGVMAGDVVAVLSGDEVRTSSELSAAIVARFDKGERSVSVGVGTPCTDLSQLRRSYLQASAAISLGRRYAAGDRRYDYSTVAPYELLSCLQSCRKAGSYCREQVERVIAYDGLKDGSLFETLEVFLDYYGHRKAAAEKLNIHPNTLDYRIRKAKEIMGLDLEDPNTRLVVHVWVKALAAKTRASVAGEDLSGGDGGGQPGPGGGNGG